MINITSVVAEAQVSLKPEFPVVVRPRRGKLLVRLPFEGLAVLSNRDYNKNYFWLSGFGRSSPGWDSINKHWVVPAAWFNELVRRLVEKHGGAYVFQRYSRLEKCAPACWTAKKLECSCSCLGEHHGEETPSGRWYIIDETCAISWGGEAWRCTFLRQKIKES